jgi:iron complex outermembrane receptor protein
MSGTEETYQAWDGVPGEILDTNRTYNGLGAYVDPDGILKYYQDQTDNYRQTHYHLNWLQKMGKKVNLSTAFHVTRGFGYYEEYKTDQQFSDYQLQNPVIGGDTILTTDLIRRRFLDNHFYGFTFGVNFDNKTNLEATIGGALNYYDGDHYGEIIWSQVTVQFEKDYRWYENQGDKTDANFFAKLNYQASARLNLYGDLQYRRINYRINGIDNDLRDISQEHVYNFFNPKIGAIYDITDHDEAYLSFAIGNREPNRSTLIDANPARPYPVSESLYDTEAGYRYRSRNLSASANLYYMYYREQIVLTGRINDVGDPVMENVDRSYRTGIEASVGILIFKNLRWDINATLSSNKIINFTEYIDNWDEWPAQITNDLGKTDIAFSPSVIAGSILAWEPITRLELSLLSKYVGKQYIDNTSSEERTLDPYFINDLLISYKLKVKSLKQCSISLKVNNFTNTEYESNAWVYRYYSQGSYGVYDGYFPQAGINFLAGLNLKF